MKRVCSSLLLAAGFLFLNTGCGLDNVVVLDPPEICYNSPTYESNFDLRFFEFETKEAGYNTDYDIGFKGTDIYYKIYNNYNTAESEAASLVNLSNDTENKANAPSRLIDYYKFKSLKASNSVKNSPVLIPANGENRRVRIRLTNYNDSEDYRAQITVDDKFLNGKDISVPYRHEDSLTFDFGRSEYDMTQKSKIPVSTDDDVSISSTASKEGMWYVSLFAIGVGMDTTFTPTYSNILYLGTVSIDQNSLMN